MIKANYAQSKILSCFHPMQFILHPYMQILWLQSRVQCEGDCVENDKAGLQLYRNSLTKFYNAEIPGNNHFPI